MSQEPERIIDDKMRPEYDFSGGWVAIELLERLKSYRMDRDDGVVNS